ncbi:MAG: hypothetical protein V4819_11345 [Verrucomicrobiota bacterium]
MSKSSENTPPSHTAWFVPGIAAGVIATAVISYARSGETYAAAGSPYYGKAVQEAIAGLKNPGGDAPPAARPPLLAGLSPDEHYWCENCKTYHKREPGQTPPVAAPLSPSLAVAAQPADVIPPLPEGLSASDHYWCVNCKTYHPRQPAPVAAGWAGVPYKLPVTPAPGN